jgi:hypothetical protein
MTETHFNKIKSTKKTPHAYRILEANPMHLKWAYSHKAARENY